MNARNFLAEVKRRNVSESRADDLAGGTKQRPPDRLVGREPPGAPNALRLQLRLKLRARRYGVGRGAGVGRGLGEPRTR
jgi:hypothetical protein